MEARLHGATFDSVHETAGGLRQRCLAMARRRAMLAAATSLLPIPLIDLALDTALLMSIIDDISRNYGLNARQIESLSPRRKALAFQLTSTAGGFLAARLGTSRLLQLILQRAGLRFGVMEACRFAPIIGQGIAALISYLTLTHLARKHIDDCARIVARLDGSGF